MSKQSGTATTGSSRRERITEATLTKIRRDLVAGVQGEYAIADEKCDGLIVRVWGTKLRSNAAWVLRGRRAGKQSRWSIGPLDDVTPTQARERAQHAKSMLRRGLDPREWLEAQLLGGPVLVRGDPEHDGWTWAEARDKFLSYVRDTRRPATYRDYRSSLILPDLASLERRHMKLVSARDIQNCIRHIGDRGKYVQARHVLTVVKVFVRWAWNEKASLTPKELLFEVGELLPPKPTTSYLRERRSEESADRLPSREELGLLPWLLYTPRSNVAAGYAVMIALLTAQRRLTVASARIEDFESLEDGRRGVWRIPGDRQKNQQDLWIPLPPYAWSMVQDAIARVGKMVGDEGWLFPKFRPRRAGDSRDGHMSPDVLDKAMREAGTRVRPHAFRHAFATYGGQDLGYTDREKKLILHHMEGRKNDVTRKHYDRNQYLDEKWPVLERWNEFVRELSVAHQPANYIPGKVVEVPTAERLRRRVSQTDVAMLLERALGMVRGR